jgi:hypothetical protein
MYPQQELNRLSARKIALRRDIAHRRARCAEDAAQATRPLEWLDRVMALWRQFAPLAAFAAVPLGLLVKRIASPRLRILRMLVRWSPLVVCAVRVVRRSVKALLRESKRPVA